LRIPITRDGLGVLAVSTVVLAVMGWLGSLLTPWVWPAVGLVWLWAVSFFRDPQRKIEQHPQVLYAPADGKVTEVVELDHHQAIGGPCVRIRIFLSIFNVHINRMPCAAKITSVKRQPGKFLNAMKAESALENESNTLMLDPADPVVGPVMVRQIVGLIARTIVCHVQPGDSLVSGQRFGMIKFGSGTEMIVPKQDGLKVLTQEGDAVRAGLTALIRLGEEDTG